MLRGTDLVRRLADRQGAVVLFGLTPPRSTSTPEKVKEVAERTLERLGALDLDGIVLYDIDDESDRNSDERPFPFASTLDPADFAAEFAEWEKPIIIYRCVGKYEEERLTTWLGEQDPERVLSVFVGASSRDKPVHTSLARAQELRAKHRPELLLGGVAIPERHAERGEEHSRLMAKQARGCSFFITQVVYDVNAAKDLLSDYLYASREEGSEPVPVIFTLSVCGSAKTLDFLQWLGVKVPRWMQNELRRTDDTLAESFEQCLATAAELVSFAERIGAPIGFNVESVSVRRAEIEASVELAARVRELVAE